MIMGLVFLFWWLQLSVLQYVVNVFNVLSFQEFQGLKVVWARSLQIDGPCVFLGNTGETTMKLYGWWASISCYTSRFYNRCWGQTAEAENRGGKNNQLDCASMLGIYLQAHCFISFSQGVEWRVSRWFIFKESGNGCLYLQPWAIWQTDKSPNSCSSHPHAHHSRGFVLLPNMSPSRIAEMTRAHAHLAGRNACHVAQMV